MVLAGILILGWWISANPVKDLAVSVPGADSAGIVRAAYIENVAIGEFFERYESEETVLSENWDRFRGPDYDNIYKGSTRLIDRFGSAGPQIMWTVELGEGHAGPAIYDGKVYLLDYDEELGADMLRCFSLPDGTELWRRWYEVRVKRNHGMSRTVPAVTENYVLTIGPRCHVMCTDRETGDFLWGIDIEKEYESEVPLWYTGQCPLIDNDLAVIATGGKALMIAVDCATGEKIWETPNPDNWKMSHSSVMPYIFKGHKMYVYSAVGGICGIAADGEEAGTVLWSTSAWNHDVIAPSPVCMPDGKIFMTAGYGAGGMVLKLSESNGNYSIEVLQEYKPVDGFACEQQTPVYTDGLLFGIMPKDGGTLRNQLVCVSPDDCTSIVWSSGQTARFGMGPYILANGKFFLLNEDGTLYIIQKDTRRYIEMDSWQVFEGQDAWAPLATADGYLVLRDSRMMYCINIKA